MSETKRTPLAIDAAGVPVRRGSSYPPDLAHFAGGRLKQALGDAVGLKNFGVNLVQLEPGATSSLRHWHTHEDEFVYVLAGEMTLVTDAGPQTLRPGMAVGFPAGVANGHHLVNHTSGMATYLEVGDRRAEDDCHYPDVDLQYRHEDGAFTRKDGTAV